MQFQNFFEGDTPGPPLREGGNPVAMTHTRPRACTSVPLQFLGPSAAPDMYDDIFVLCFFSL